MNHHNGYQSRARETRAGKVDVMIPKLRKGSYLPEILEPRRAAVGRVQTDLSIETSYLPFFTGILAL
ncbi:transposase (plasmid) [Sulfitobacter sp. OXR-159]|nr:transposase [Sulfitobacter sp. OXR-159]WPZ31601.1 transposase [Sulfitobacter sp. OXR-159]